MYEYKYFNPPNGDLQLCVYHHCKESDKMFEPFEMKIVKTQSCLAQDVIFYLGETSDTTSNISNIRASF